MEHIKKYLLIVPAALLVMGWAVPAVARGEDSDSGSDSGSSSDTSKDSDSTSSSEDKAAETEIKTIRDNLKVRLDRHEQVQDGAEKQAEKEGVENELRHKGDNILAELFKEVKHHHTAAEKRKNCQAAEHGLETKLSNLKGNSQKYLDRVNSVLSKTLDYQAANNLNPSGIADLISKATAAQAAATTSVANLQVLSPNIDCSSSSVAQDVATFKAAGQDAKTSLQTYRQSVNNIIEALLEAGGSQ